MRDLILVVSMVFALISGELLYIKFHNIQLEKDIKLKD